MMKRFFVLAFLTALFCTQVLDAQTQSVLNRYGIGNLEYSYSARKAGMGDLGTAVEDKDYISVSNPASWNLINSSRFEFGTIFNGLYVKDNSDSRFYSKGYFSGFVFGVPLYSAWGITAAAGIIPYSTIGYEAKTEVAASTVGTTVVPAYTVTSKGDGGVSKIFFGSSYRYKEVISLGATLDYYFGNRTYKSQIDFNGSGTNSQFSRSYKGQGVGGTFGFISGDVSRSLLQFPNVSGLKFGAAFSFISSLNTDSVLITNSNLFADTNSYGSGKIEMPLRLSAGISFKLYDKYLMSLDYLYQDWSGYTVNSASDPNLAAVSKFSLGSEYRVAADGGAWDRMIYRCGVSYGSSPYKINGSQINELGLSAGLSVAVARDNYLDLGIQYLRRGSVTDNFIQENLIKVTVGVSLGELWVQREER